ncbi:MAG: OmpA family protein [Planctomycetales bacterium]
MRGLISSACLAVVVLTVSVGCARNPYVLQGKVEHLQADHEKLASDYADLEHTKAALDESNQDLQTQVAQALQQSQVHEKDARALRDALRESAEQLARMRTENRDLETQLTDTSDLPRAKPQATITANSSLRNRLPAFRYQGVEVRADGDVIRVELPGDQIFEQGGVRFRAAASHIVEDVAAEIARAYPNQIIGVEGHTDADSLPQGSRWLSNHHLSVGRATALYDYLAGRKILPMNQMFIVGHGANHPVVSNGSDAGKARNRRVELVVYPDLVPQ